MFYIVSFVKKKVSKISGKKQLKGINILTGNLLLTALWSERLCCHRQRRGHRWSWQTRDILLSATCLPPASRQGTENQLQQL